MPFWRRRNKHPPASLSFHSTEHLQQPNPRFSVPADPPLQAHRQPQHRQPSPSPLPPPPEQQLRRAQTQQFPLAAPDPSRSAPISSTPDDSRKLQKKKAVLPQHAPAPSKSSSSSSARDLPGFLGRSLSVKTPRSRPTNTSAVTTNTTNTNTTTTTTGLRQKGHVVTSQSIPEISMPGNPESPVQPRPSVSTTATATEKSPLINPSDQPHYQPYRPSSQQSGVSSLPSVNTQPSVNNTNEPSMAADRTPGPQAQAGRQSPYPDSKNEQGRSTPGPGQKREEDERSLPQKHDELLAKYSKVKRYYFEKEAQVQHLQNTVAHQRMAVSRTVLDDNEYANRFGRLDGAIKDLAFNIRKDWKSLPQWLLGYVNDDAHTVGMKEMTAIGRAFMSRWLVEEIFQRHFHPALDLTLSQQLKSIENNLRFQHVTKPVQTEEDKENAIAKISNWRRTTFDGLGDAVLHGRTAEENRAQLIEQLVTKLLATLEGHLNTPPPVGMENSARMIVENAVGIAEKIPLESRDVCVEYPSPGSMVENTRMRVEAGIPALTNVKPENARPRPSLDQENNPAGQGSNDAESEDNNNNNSSNSNKDNEPSPSPSTSSGPQSQPQQQPQQQPQLAAADTGKRKTPTTVFNQLMGKRSPPTSTAPTPTTAPSPAKGREEEREKEAWIRFASFMFAEVRGKGPVNVLAKAPVYLLE